MEQFKLMLWDLGVPFDEKQSPALHRIDALVVGDRYSVELHVSLGDGQYVIHVTPCGGARYQFAAEVGGAGMTVFQAGVHECVQSQLETVRSQLQKVLS